MMDCPVEAPVVFEPPPGCLVTLQRVIELRREYREQRGIDPKFLAIGKNDFVGLVWQSGWPHGSTMPDKVLGLNIVILPPDLLPPGGLAVVGSTNDEVFR